MSKLTEEEKKIQKSFNGQVGEGFRCMTLTYNKKKLKEIIPKKRG